MKLQVAIMFGGMSCEHEISCISANQAMHALNKDKYDLIPIYISKDQRMYTGDALLELSNYSNLNQLISGLVNINLIRNNNTVCVEPTKKSLFAKNSQTIDVVIPIVHGTNGEDGVLQGYLEMLKVAYAGCNVSSASVGQDKIIQKCVLSANGISVCPWFWLYEYEFMENKEANLVKANNLGYPVIIKPANLGSSIGIEIVHNDDEFIEGIKRAGQFDEKLLVEKVITNLCEINASVLGDVFKHKVSVLEQVLKNDEILTFTDKYQGNAKNAKTKTTTKGSSKGMASTSRLVPAPISEELTNEIKMIAARTFKAIGASGVCRIDFMIDEDNNQVYVNEVNTIPGSLAFYLWTEEGITFDLLLDELIKIAIDNVRRKEKKILSFDTNILQSFAKK